MPFEDLVFSRGDITLFGESRQQLLGADMLRIRLSLIGEGHYEGLADGGPMYFSGHSCILIDQAAGAGLSQVTESDSRHCGITLHIPRFLLTEAWGLNPAALPAFFREFEEQPRREARGLTMPLVPELTWPVLEILRCQLGGELLNLYLGGAAREIISLLLEQMKRMQDEQGQRPPPVVLHRRDLKLLHDARLLVTKNYNNPPRLSELAAAVGLNRNKLCVGFKRLFGQPVHEYCRELRLQHAIKLLREGDMPLVDIALQVGYQHAPAFSSAFKKRFGCSPKDLRRRGTILPGE